MSTVLHSRHRPSPGSTPASAAETLRMLVHYKRWANRLTFSQVLALPEGEALKQRQTRFGNMVHTLNHVFVVDDIFRHHLESRRHGYTARNTDTTPPLLELRARVEEMDQWYIDQAENWTDEDFATVIRFEFVGGGEGAMTRAEIVLHVVNHATYHRGFVGDMMYQVPVMPVSNDLPVFLRDVWKKAR
ncbi:MAG: damage-inducible protein DinB [Methylobacterium sp.]|nr:MAG: damage-inducible protein DinB [Methylobacterium sp.]